MNSITRTGFFLLLLLAGIWACTPEEEQLSASPVRLAFSADTLNFDTLFTTEKSVTRRLWVYNPAENAVRIDRLSLQSGADSPYTLYVHGSPAKSFQNIRLLGVDSLLLLVEALLPNTSDLQPYSSPDAIVFENQQLSQQIPLVSFGQNARFVAEEVLPCNTVWKAGLPYIISSSVLVDSLCTLKIEPGAHIYFKPEASLFVKGTVLAEGDSANQIVFQNQRQDGLYAQAFGQWGGLIFLESSKNNKLSYCNIRNAETGIRLGTPDEDDEPDLVLAHCRIENMLQAGILAFTSDLYAYNTLVANCADFTVANLAGGNYRYEHCTFVNYFTGLRDRPAGLFTDNILLDNNELLSAPLSLSLKNSIIWGNLSSGSEWLIDNGAAEPLMLNLNNNIIRTNSQELAADNLISQEPGFMQFQDPYAGNFMPDTLSVAVNAGLELGFSKDLFGARRDSLPDIGAIEYRYISSKEE